MRFSRMFCVLLSLISDVLALDCYFCETSSGEKACNETQKIIKCGTDKSENSDRWKNSDSVCMIQEISNRFEISPGEFFLETEYIKDCGFIDEPYCHKLKDSSTGLHSCKTYLCEEDLCNISKQTAKVNEKQSNRGSTYWQYGNGCTAFNTLNIYPIVVCVILLHFQ